MASLVEKARRRRPSGKEKSRYAAQVVLYTLEGGSWKSVAGEGEWSEMHVFCRSKGTKRRAFRTVAWVSGTQRTVMNVKLEPDMTIELTSGDFGELRCGADSGGTYGMYFASETQASETVDAVRTALRELTAAPRRSLASFELVEESTQLAAGHSVSHEENEQSPPSSQRASASLRTAAETLGGSSGSSAVAAADAGPRARAEEEATDGRPSVSDFTHETHVTFNAELSRYEGLPPGWSHVNKQFGVELARVPRARAERRDYPDKIPTVLLMLETALHDLDGLAAVGVFRVAPDKDDCQAAKEAIDSGEPWTDFRDVHVVATLIKQFFRDLPPVGLLNSLDDAAISGLADSSDAADVDKAFDLFPRHSAALCLWLLDLMADVVQHEHSNRMSAKNMAIVFSPNLYSTQQANPMAALTMAQKVADCTNNLLLWRINSRL